MGMQIRRSVDISGPSGKGRVRLEFDGTTFTLSLNTTSLLTGTTSGIASAPMDKLRIGATTVDGLLGGAGATASPLDLGSTAGTALNFRFDSSHTTGDMRANYTRLKFSGVGGSGEAGRFVSEIAAAGAAAGGTINGMHNSLLIDAAGTVSGAANAMRLTLALVGAADPGGTVSCLQIDSDFDNAATVDAKLPAIRLTNSNTKLWPVLMEIPNASNGTIFAAHTTEVVSHSIKIKSADGTLYYVMCTNTATHRS